MNDLLSRWLAATFSHPDLLGALVIAGKTAVIYLFLILGLRILGKRELGQMSIYDLVLIIVISNSVQNAMVGKDTTLVGGLVAALTLLIIDRVFTSLLIRHSQFKHWMIGEPVLIVRDGQILQGPMEKQGVTRAHVEAAMREHGIDDLKKVQMAVLEVDGTISIVQAESDVHRSHRRYKGLHTA
jgi:uncharacterized membrane protein YcaP (DUF421 family)